jgi:hypothetical protein
LPCLEVDRGEGATIHATVDAAIVSEMLQISQHSLRIDFQLHEDLPMNVAEPYD